VVWEEHQRGPELSWEAMADVERIGRLGETWGRDEKDSEYVDLVEVHGCSCRHQLTPDINTQIQGGTATQTLL